MPQRTVVEIPPEEQAQMRAARRRARYGDLLALHLLVWSAAGRPPTDIAAALVCARSSVVPHRARLSPGSPGLGARRPGAAHAPHPHHGAAPDPAAVARGAAAGPPTGVWVVPHALEWRHAGRDPAGHAGRQGLDRDAGHRNGPWTSTRSDLYDAPAVTAAVENIAAEENAKGAA